MAPADDSAIGERANTTNLQNDTQVDTDADGWPDIKGFEKTIACEIFGGDVGFFREMLEPFLKDYASADSDLNRLLQAGEHANAARFVHKLVGQAANLGALELKNAGRALEDVLNDQSRPYDNEAIAFGKAHARFFTQAMDWLERKRIAD